MFYLLIAIILVSFYIFVAPKHIKSTINLVASVFILVGLVIALMLGMTKMIQAPLEIWVSVLMVVLGLWALYDLYYLDKIKPSSKKRRPYRHRF